MRWVLWEETNEGEIPYEFETLEDMWDTLNRIPGEDLSTFIAITEKVNGRTKTYTIEDTEMEERYYES